jgi:hypothetical protein
MGGCIAHGNGFCFRLREEGAVWRIGFLMLLFFQEVRNHLFVSPTRSMVPGFGCHVSKMINWMKFVTKGAL